jgi:peptide/nickel transport system permease protein
MRRNYILKKTLYAAITILIVLVFNYVLFRVLPGDPLAMIMRNPKATPEMIDTIRIFYGLDQPWYTQFIIYFQNLFHGDLGMSFIYKKDVAAVIAPRILPTVYLLGLAEILAIVVGIVLGIIAASRRGTRIDVGTLGFALVTYAMPTFWLGMIMVSIFSVGLHLFPVGGMESPGMAFADLGPRLIDIIHHSILPIITMSILLIGEYALTMRNTLMDVLSEDYITTAKAKGFGEKYILRKHAVPNAMLPMVTIVAMNLGLVVGGAIQIETIFSWPGLGTLMYSALTARDYPLLQGLFLLITVSVVIANYIADLTYTYIDPRVKE